MTHGSLFSGIGGFDIAAEWMGWLNTFHCEWNPFGRRILDYYWPNAESFQDIKKSDFTKYANSIDILSGGFPCQPYSMAGKRKGKEDERHLWPEMLRAIREIQPGWVVGENVSGIVNWNGGLVFDEVQAELEAESFRVLPFLLPACAVDAPHQRERAWFIAYSDRNRNRLEQKSNREKNSIQGSERPAICPGQSTGAITGNVTNAERTAVEQTTNRRAECKQEGQEVRALNSTGGKADANTDGQRLQGGLHANRSGLSEQQLGERNARSFERRGWENFPIEPALCGGNDGISRELDGITFSKWRSESVKAYGNAVVPQVVYEIFKVIEAYVRLQKAC